MQDVHPRFRHRRAGDRFATGRPGVAKWFGFDPAVMKTDPTWSPDACCSDANRFSLKSAGL